MHIPTHLDSSFLLLLFRLIQLNLCTFSSSSLKSGSTQAPSSYGPSSSHIWILISFDVTWILSTGSRPAFWIASIFSHSALPYVFTSFSIRSAALYIHLIGRWFLNPASRGEHVFCAGRVLGRGIPGIPVGCRNVLEGNTYRFQHSTRHSRSWLATSSVSWYGQSFSTLNLSSSLSAASKQKAFNWFNSVCISSYLPGETVTSGFKP